MREEQDAMMVVRAELCERLATMQALATRATLHDLEESACMLRHVAAAYGITPVVRLIEALENAMAEQPSACPTTLYLERLQDAIGCGVGDEQTSQAMIASVAVRLSA